MKLLRFASILLVLLTLTAGVYFYMAYNDFSCHGCMSIPGIEEAKKDKVLIAKYTSDQENCNDTLYLSRSINHGKGYQYYSEAYFVGYDGELDPSIVEIKSKQHLANVLNGKISGLSGINTIPEEIQMMDSNQKIKISFKLIQQYSENIVAIPSRSYIREWKTILGT